MQLSEINIYPLKSGRGISLSSSELTRRGLLSDRRWMLVDESNKFVTQRQYSKMCLISASPSMDKISFSYDGEWAHVDNIEENLDVVISSKSELRRVQVWQDAVEAFDCGDEAADWFSKILNTSVRLVFQSDSHLRTVDQAFGKTGDLVSFADGFPILLISQASLDVLNERLGSQFLMNRFRPNLVVSGCEAHAEDNWKRIRINSVEFEVVKPCSRCVIPSIEPNTGVKNSDILLELAKYRKGEDGKIYFGQNLIHQSLGTLALGDKVEVIT